MPGGCAAWGMGKTGEERVTIHVVRAGAKKEATPLFDRATLQQLHRLRSQEKATFTLGQKIAGMHFYYLINTPSLSPGPFGCRSSRNSWHRERHGVKWLRQQDTSTMRARWAEEGYVPMKVQERICSYSFLFSSDGRGGSNKQPR